jgi:(p)ppGpp synthase/HD superfamily hydrolase
MAALMHDVMEDCGITKQDLAERFGTRWPTWSTA